MLGCFKFCTRCFICFSCFNLLQTVSWLCRYLSCLLDLLDLLDKCKCLLHCNRTATLYCFNMLACVLALRKACTDAINNHSSCQPPNIAAAANVACIAVVLIMCAIVKSTSAGADVTDVVNLLKWLDGFLLVNFLLLYTWSTLDQFDCVALAVIFTEKQPAN